MTEQADGINFQEKLFSLRNDVTELKTIQKKDMEKIDHIVSSIEQKIDSINDDLNELKQNHKLTIQNDRNLTELKERTNGLDRELSAKMVTKDELQEMKYKDWRVWLAIGSLVLVAIATVASSILTYLSKGN
ncbi:MAG: hypothetical protein ACQERD_12500 [Campylobacterota bacterium]